MKVKYEELFDKKVGKNACIEEIMRFMEDIDENEHDSTKSQNKKRKRANKKNNKVTSKIKAVDCSVKIKFTGFKIACKHDHEHEHHESQDNQEKEDLDNENAKSSNSSNKYDILKNEEESIADNNDNDDNDDHQDEDVLDPNNNDIKPLPIKSFEIDLDTQLAIWIEQRRQQLLEIDTKALHDKIKCRYLNCVMCKKVDAMKISDLGSNC